MSQGVFITNLKLSSESLKAEPCEIIFQPLMLIYVNFVSMQRESAAASDVKEVKI